MKGVSDIRKCFLYGLFIADTIALYTLLGVKHLLSNGQLDLLLQLQPQLVGPELIILPLLEEILELIFLQQLLLNLTVFLLKSWTFYDILENDASTV